jgi:hypothetical protein
MGVKLSHSLREKCRLRVFENRMLRKTLGRRETRQQWEWRRLHNEGFYDVYSSPNIIRMIESRRMRRGWREAPRGERSGTCRILIEKRVGKRPLGKLSRK